ncbi:MAG: nitroreductase family protein [Clostridia bacterium]|nr:nitroreductase family protein [Clostridia bacterium]
MNIKDIIYERRTIRKFTDRKVSDSDLNYLIDLARMAPSGSNMQPLKYAIVNQEDNVQKVFKLTKWAGYLKGKGSPDETERPTAFIIVLNDEEIRKEGYELDAGASIQNILLGATEKGIGTAWLGAIDRDEIRNILEIPMRFRIISAIALGYANYKTVIEEEKGDIKYYLDNDDVLHIPKRKNSDIIVLTK